MASTGKKDNDPNLNRQNPGLGTTGTGSDFGKTSTTSQGGTSTTEHHGIRSDNGRTGYGFPTGTTQQQYDRGTTTGQSGISEQQQYGQGVDVGHHKHHHESHLHRYGPGEAAIGGTLAGQDTGNVGVDSSHQAKPSVTDKIIGGVEKITGKMTSNTEMYQRGEERAAGERQTAAKKN